MTHTNSHLRNGYEKIVAGPNPPRITIHDMVDMLFLLVPISIATGIIIGGIIYLCS